MQFESSIGFARTLDQQDPLKRFRSAYHVPVNNGEEVIYFCGNSLGLQPRITGDYIQSELQKWKDQAVEGHFREPGPWVSYHKMDRQHLAELTGSKENEVVAMNNLTTNLHLMLASFYLPNKNRRKLIIESGAFPSDHFAVSSFMKTKGVDPEVDLVVLEIPENGYLSTGVIIEKIRELGDELALVMLPGIQYYTGQWFDMRTIAAAAHEVGAFAGFDLAHAIGNVPLTLHDDAADFAVWCSYKYLNSGPGAVAGAFVHEKFGNDPSWPRLAGWWGQRESTRFKMETSFEPEPGIDGWMLSNVNVVSTACHRAALSLFAEAGMELLREKSIKLTAYLEFLLNESKRLNDTFRIITPGNPDERGCQLSLFTENGKNIFETLSSINVITDWREPDVIRVAPTPMYNTFEEVHKFVTICESVTRERDT